MSEIATFPEWQKAIREAQQRQSAIVEAKIAEVQAEVAVQDAEDGGKLAVALKFLGIEIEAPPRNEYIRDGYRFRVKVRSGGMYDDTAVFMQRDGQIKFTLYINKPMPAEIPSDYENWRCADELEVHWRDEAGDWTELQARLADKLDDLDHIYEIGLAGFRKSQTVVKSFIREVSPEEKLLESLKAFIRQHSLEAVGDII